MTEKDLNIEFPAIMGVLNVTPDSFYDGGKHFQKEKALSQARKMIEEGAVIIDIGGESSRPGADPVAAEEEMQRVLPVIEGIRAEADTLISIDTSKWLVAEKALAAGANWLNDISGYESEQMLEIVKKRKCPVVLMHMQGTPQTMQKNPRYEDVCREINAFFKKRIAFLNENGITKIILDPGIGFGKRLQDNIDLIRNMAVFKKHGLPVLIGLSRKSFLGDITGRTATERMAATITANHIAVLNGADIIRVHDVAETADMLKIAKSLS